jgi:hypothetical protein
MANGKSANQQIGKSANGEWRMVNGKSQYGGGRVGADGAIVW